MQVLAHYYDGSFYCTDCDSNFSLTEEQLQIAPMYVITQENVSEVEDEEVCWKCNKKIK